MIKDNLYLSMAKEISRHSKCLKGNWGVVIVKNDMVIGAGYNGPARGISHCNPCYREGCPPGQGYDKCIAVHAEVNALLQAGGRERCLGATLYINSHNRKPDSQIRYNSILGDFPCDNCFRCIVNAGIKEIVQPDENGNPVHHLVVDLVRQVNHALAEG